MLRSAPAAASRRGRSAARRATSCWKSWRPAGSTGPGCSAGFRATDSRAWLRGQSRRSARRPARGTGTRSGRTLRWSRCRPGRVHAIEVPALVAVLPVGVEALVELRDRLAGVECGRGRGGQGNGPRRNGDAKDPECESAGPQRPCGNACPSIRRESLQARRPWKGTLPPRLPGGRYLNIMDRGGSRRKSAFRGRPAIPKCGGVWPRRRPTRCSSREPARLGAPRSIALDLDFDLELLGGFLIMKKKSDLGDARHVSDFPLGAAGIAQD